MKHLIKTLVLLFIPFLSFLQAQNRANVHFAYGHYLSNSENSTNIMNGKTFGPQMIFGFNYERENILGLNLVFEYDYSNTKVKEVMKWMSLNDNLRPYFINADMSLIHHNFDLSLKENINQSFAWGAGPSFVITNRIFDLEPWIYDKLASSGIGLNGFFEFSYPLLSSNDLLFNTKFKIRYAHSFWFDKGIRDLSNYRQDYVTAQLSAGIAFSF